MHHDRRVLDTINQMEGIKNEEKVDLKKKSKQELQVMLELKEKLLKNKKFIDRLPDRGAKIHESIKSIKAALFEADDMDKMTTRLGGLRLHDESTYLDKLPIVDRIWLGEDRSDKNRFLPNKSLKAKSVHEIDIPRPSTQNPRSSPSIRDNEESAAFPKPLKYESTKQIPLDESFKILEQQNKKYEDLLAQHAMERLVDQLGFKMGPIGPQLKENNVYRQPEVESSEESDKEDIVIRDSNDEDDT